MFVYWGLIIFANILDPDKARHLVGPDMDPNCLHSDGRDHTFCTVASGLNCLRPTKRIENVGFTPQFLCESSLLYKKFRTEN